MSPSSSPMFSLAERCRIVLVRPGLAANIGAVARVMANFGLSRLALVQPEVAPVDPQALAVATHGEGVLHAAQTFGDLGTAVADCGLVVGTSARAEGLIRGHTAVSVRGFMPRLLDAMRQTSVAIVFGPERTGLTNEEVTRSHYLLTIPTAEAFPVLNLGQAVAICLSELYQALLPGGLQPEPSRVIADFASQERAYLHLEAGLRAIHFLWNEKADAQMHALRHLIGRAQTTPVELELIHGMARQMEWYAAHHPRVTEDESPLLPGS